MVIRVESGAGCEDEGEKTGKEKKRVHWQADSEVGIWHLDANDMSSKAEERMDSLLTCFKLTFLGVRTRKSKRAESVLANPCSALSPSCANVRSKGPEFCTDPFQRGVSFHLRLCSGLPVNIESQAL